MSGERQMFSVTSGELNPTSGVPVSTTLRMPRRTNALGWARTDCHTCQATSRGCDRRRPICGPCISLGIVCGGFVQKLNWQNQGQQASSEDTPGGLITSSDGKACSKTTEYVFVQEDGRDKKQGGRMADQRRRLNMRRWVEHASASSLLYSYQPDYFHLPSSTLEQLAFFTWRFSPVTLTYTIEANPWQACLPQIDRAPCLLFAIRALAVRHRAHLEESPESLSVLELKHQALSSYSQLLATVPLEVGISTSLLLLAIDYTESAYGNWTVHLQGVLKMIQAAGSLQLGHADMNLKAQLAQLIWYDTVIALLSRRGPVFPRTYVEHILSWKSDVQWSMLALSGFPDAAFLDMYDIAEAAAHASSLSDGDATSLEMKLWLAQFDTVGQIIDKEMSALTECWRLGLLLYCIRVFHQGENMKKRTRQLAEEIIWLVHEIPPLSDKQKQAAIPLFLAACEVQSPRFRQIAIDFCERWKKRSGLWLNQTIIDLVRRVWALLDENPDKDIWWGDLVEPSSELCYLFG
ncbi:fungal-specific transcription factor domain-containing protein [Lophiotrema nucula]|uniref:Fungal-specific transcription factor domain-containing protein n=1 Tax=Lophiotrema nucula TaxID=690887 RepID=A0A6A5ZSS1_9PLEO|nr:fungal-specific transcription factor domain-containing protein [Lophiotrema nucula]